MQAIGMLETVGLLAAIEGLDVMLKSAEVSFVNRNFVTGGLVCITVRGDIAAVQASLKAATIAVNNIGTGLIFSAHIIPRPDRDIYKVFFVDDEEKKITFHRLENEKPFPRDESINNGKSFGMIEFTPEAVEQYYYDKGLDELLSYLKHKTVPELRRLARSYEDFIITGRKISRAKKAELLACFETYFSDK